jgi:hypothetical protein
VKTHNVKIYYCPVCSKKFYDLKSNEEGLRLMELHLEFSHVHYFDTLYKEI